MARSSTTRRPSWCAGTLAVCAGALALGVPPAAAGVGADQAHPVRHPGRPRRRRDQMARFIQGVVAKHNLSKQPIITVNRPRGGRYRLPGNQQRD